MKKKNKAATIFGILSATNADKYADDALGAAAILSYVGAGIVIATDAIPAVKNAAAIVASGVTAANIVVRGKNFMEGKEGCKKNKKNTQ